MSSRGNRASKRACVMFGQRAGGGVKTEGLFRKQRGAPLPVNFASYPKAVGDADDGAAGEGQVARLLSRVRLVGVLNCEGAKRAEQRVRLVCKWGLGHIKRK